MTIPDFDKDQLAGMLDYLADDDGNITLDSDAITKLEENLLQWADEIRDEYGDERFEDGQSAGDESGYERGYEDGIQEAQERKVTPRSQAWTHRLRDARITAIVQDAETGEQLDDPGLAIVMPEWQLEELTRMAQAS